MIFTEKNKTTKYNYDVTRIKRNQFISKRELHQILGQFDEYFNLKVLNFKDWLESEISRLISEGLLDQELVVKQEDWGLIFLGGEDAVRYLDKQVDNDLNRAKKKNKRIFDFSINEVEHHKIDEYLHHLRTARLREAYLNKAPKSYS